MTAMTNNPNGLAFYNGTAFPIVSTSDMSFPKMSYAMIVLGLRDGVSLQQQGKDYKQQMDHMEGELCKITKGEMIKQCHINKWCKGLGQTEDELMFLWYLNVIALEKLKVIKNDNMNGMMYINENVRN